MDALGVLQKLGAGHLIEDLALALIDVAEQVVATEKPGSVTLSFKLERAKSQPAVIITEQIKRGIPVPEARGALLYAVGDGELHDRDPRQAAMDFRVVADPETGTKTLVETDQPVRKVD